MILQEVARPQLKDLVSWDAPNRPAEFNLSNLELVGSGKGALALILGFLTKQGIIKNKMDEILVPGWLGYWVYNQMQPFVFPVKQYSPKTKIIFVYHQYGFPQNMDAIVAFAKEKNLIVIEDCAHALVSSYHGKSLGTFGDFTLYSFSKWFFCFALGGVSSKIDGFSEYIRTQIKNSPCGATFIKDTFKLLSELCPHNKYANLLIKSSYAFYGDALQPGWLAKKLLFQKLDFEITLRRRRYEQFIRATSHLGICDHLEQKGIAPYIIPILVKASKIETIIQKLKAINIATGVYQFDKNRNILNPNFVPCLWIPCHSGISDKTFDDLMEIIIQALK